MSIIVRNLMRDEEQVFVGISPKEALIAAVEQSKGNFNTWTYKDSKLVVKETTHTYYIGDLAGIKEKKTEGRREA